MGACRPRTTWSSSAGTARRPWLQASKSFLDVHDRLYRALYFITGELGGRGGAHAGRVPQAVRAVGSDRHDRGSRRVSVPQCAQRVTDADASHPHGRSESRARRLRTGSVRRRERPRGCAPDATRTSSSPARGGRPHRDLRIQPAYRCLVVHGSVLTWEDNQRDASQGRSRYGRRDDFEGLPSL